MGQATWIPKTVLLETEWVLRSSYRLGSETASRALEKLLGLETVLVEDQQAVAKALFWHRAGFDFADAMHLASSAEADGFATFDQKLQRRAESAGVRPPVTWPK